MSEYLGRVHAVRLDNWEKFNAFLLDHEHNLETRDGKHYIYLRDYSSFSCTIEFGQWLVISAHETCAVSDEDFKQAYFLLPEKELEDALTRANRLTDPAIRKHEAVDIGYQIRTMLLRVWEDLKGEVRR